MLLVAWVTQQFLFDRWNGELSRLTSAEARWDVYRSNHYIFNALRSDDPADDTKPLPDVVKWQLRNLEVGMDNLEKLIPPDLLKSTRNEIMDAEDGGFGGPDGAMDIRFKVIKMALERHGKAVRDRKSRAQLTFWGLYLVGACLALTATWLREMPERQSQARASSG